MGWSSPLSIYSSHFNSPSWDPPRVPLLDALTTVRHRSWATGTDSLSWSRDRVCVPGGRGECRTPSRPSINVVGSSCCCVKSPQEPQGPWSVSPGEQTIFWKTEIKVAASAPGARSRLLRSNPKVPCAVGSLCWTLPAAGENSATMAAIHRTAIISSIDFRGPQSQSFVSKGLLREGHMSPPLPCTGGWTALWGSSFPLSFAHALPR